MDLYNIILIITALICLFILYHKEMVALLKARITDLENQNAQLKQKYSDREKEIQNLYFLLLEQKINQTIGIGTSVQPISLPSGYYFALAVINAIKGYYAYKRNQNV